MVKSKDLAFSSCQASKTHVVQALVLIFVCLFVLIIRQRSCQFDDHHACEEFYSSDEQAPRVNLFLPLL